MKKLGEMGAWAYAGTAQFFEYPLLSRERVKLITNLKFGRCIHNVHGTQCEQSPLKIWQKREHGRIQGLPKCF